MLETERVYKKFQHPKITAKGEERAYVDPTQLETLWINTGTLCNLACENCYIESSPTNDRLVYIKHDEVKSFLQEIKEKNYPVKEIAYTGGEPFMNPEIVSLLETPLKESFEVLVLSNAMKPMMLKKNQLLELQKKYKDKLKIRISLDHHSKELHEKERGPKTFDKALEGISFLAQNNFKISIASRSFGKESETECRQHFSKLFDTLNVKLDASNPSDLIVFAEMDQSKAVPEITTACWDILGKKPEQIMCANSRMVVKRKGDKVPKVLACTLLAYQKEFELGETLEESQKRIYLNHQYCSQFCVLGSSSCSA